MREKSKDIPVHTEHLLFECTVSDLNAGDLRLFRAPTVHDGSGTYKRLPHEITLNDLLVAHRPGSWAELHKIRLAQGRSTASDRISYSKQETIAL